MSPCKLILDVVLSYLKEQKIEGIKSNEIEILPEGRVPATAGQRFITISPQAVRTVTQDQIRAEVVSFQISLIQRIRDVPNDRYGIVYTDPIEMHSIHDDIKNHIQSLLMLGYLQSYQVDVLKAPRTYSITRNFNHQITILDPIHLYPSWFLGKPSVESTARLAGYRTYSTFTSPRIYPLVNPLGC